MRPMVIVLFLTALAASPIVADDFHPPEWRGDPLTVQVEWDFSQDFVPDPNNIYPESLIVVGDGIHDFNHGVTHAHTSAAVYWEVDPNDPTDGRAYTTEFPGQIRFIIGNWFDTYAYKYIWCQITFGGQGQPFINYVISPPWDDPFVGTLQQIIEFGPNQRVEEWIIMPNPSIEDVYLEIPPYTWVDQVLFDTVSSDVVAAASETWSGVKNLFR